MKQERGKTKILKRVLGGEIHASPSDKGKLVVVTPLELYYRMVETHTEKDEKVQWRRLGLAQKMVRSQARSLAKIFKLEASRSERNKVRCHDNVSSWACDLPVLRKTAKTDKDVDSNRLPKSRLIVEAARGLTTPLGEILSDLIEPVAKARTPRWEAQSNEEVLRMIKSTNLRLENEGVKNVVIGSLDVIALYPSISQTEGLKIITEEVMKSQIDYENVDMHLCGLYIDMMLTKDELRREGLNKLIPNRKAQSNRGRRPTVHTKELAGPRKKEQERKAGETGDGDMEEDLEIEGAHI